MSPLAPVSGIGITIGRIGAALAACLAFPAGLAAAQEMSPPPAVPLWSIASDDCAGVHADGEPWQECGFQAFAMNADGTRILTVSWGGAIQLWDGDGHELRRIDWPDDHRTGASGYPSGRVAIVGTIGVAVTHHNQLLVLDIADGRTLAQRVVGEVMSFTGLRGETPDGLLADTYSREWRTQVRELRLPGGELRPVPDSPLVEWPRFWLVGERAPFAVHESRPEGVPGAALWSCTPMAERFCFRRDLPGRYLHYVDIRERGGGGRSVDIGRELGQSDTIRFAVAGDRPYAVICGRSPEPYPPRNPCHVRDLRENRAIYAFTAGNLRVDGGVDERGRPELRLSVFQEPGEREQRRVSPEGAMRVIDGAGRANLGPPGGGLILPDGEGASLLIGRDGRPVARLPFHAQMCGSGWPDWRGWCRISADGRRWLVPAHSRVDGEGYGGEVRRAGLSLYELPSTPFLSDR